MWCRALAHSGGEARRGAGHQLAGDRMEGNIGRQPLLEKMGSRCMIALIGGLGSCATMDTDMVARSGRVTTDPHSRMPLFVRCGGNIPPLIIEHWICPRVLLVFSLRGYISYNHNVSLYPPSTF